jgi:glucose/mannose-6-phosphate isomerase
MSNPQHEALKKFTHQINFAIDHYKAHGLSIDEFKQVVICGMGGSGIGGQIVKSIFQSKATIPIICIADYNLPKFVNKDTLVILASYSGNTEETLSATKQALSLNCKLLALTTGGKLKEITDENHIQTYIIESGFQPRMALGFSLTYLLLILAELIGENTVESLKDIAVKIDTNQHDLYSEAEEIFKQIKNKVESKFVVITDSDYEPIGVRFAQQIQENAKHECFVHVVPEMNHNVIESYYGSLNTVFFFIYSLSHDRCAARFEFLTNLLELENHKVVTIAAEGFTLEQVYEIIYVLDWVSLLVADFRKVDSLAIHNIMSLKEFLEQIK